MTRNTSQDKELNGRDVKSGQFVMGHSGYGGRPKGSRNKLGEQFIADVYRKWKRHGADVLDRVIRDEPAQFLKTVAALMPKELHAELDMNISVIAEARSFNEAYAFCLRHIGAETVDATPVELIEADTDAAD